MLNTLNTEGEAKKEHENGKEQIWFHLNFWNLKCTFRLPPPRAIQFSSVPQEHPFRSL